MRFTQCRTNSPLCGPARACLAQAMRYHKAGVQANNFDMDRSRPTFFKDLRNAGYHVATCGKNDLHKHTKWCGLDGWTDLLGEMGFTDAIEQLDKRTAARVGRAEDGGPMCPWTALLHEHGLYQAFYDDHHRRLKEASLETAAWPGPIPRHLYSDDFCGQAAITLMDRFPRNQPWLHWINFPGPHDPMDPPRELQARYDGVTFDMPVDPPVSYGNNPCVDHQQVRRNYAAQITGIDEWVGRLIDHLQQRGELDNTYIFFSSDHGEMLGDHRKFTKHVPYEGSVHVPLIVAGPGVQAGKVSHALVELIDLAATMLDLAGQRVSEQYDARSFRGVLEGAIPDKAHRDIQVSQLSMGKRNWRMAFDGRYKLVVDGYPQQASGQAVQLFDIAHDWREMEDVAAQQSAVVQHLHRRLVEEIGDTNPFES